LYWLNLGWIGSNERFGRCRPPLVSCLAILNADVMIVGQDWGDQRAFEKQSGRDDPSSATNQMLRKLMASAGISVPTQTDRGTSGVFLTNAVLCLRKEGGCGRAAQKVGHSPLGK